MPRYIKGKGFGTNRFCGPKEICFTLKQSLVPRNVDQSFRTHKKKERETHLLKKLALLLKAELIEMTRDGFEVVAKAPAGYVWADNGLEEIEDSQWEGESKSAVRNNIAARMQKGLMKA